MLDKVISLLPNHTHALNDKAVIYFRKGDNDSAIALWDRALETDPANSNVLRNILNVSKEMGRRKEMAAFACRTLERVVGFPEKHHQVLTVLKEYDLPEKSAHPPPTLTSTANGWTTKRGPTDSTFLRSK